MKNQKSVRRIGLFALLLFSLLALTLFTARAAGNSITSPDTAGSVGRFTSLALDGSGNPVISYYDDSKGDLKLLHCNDPDCAGGDDSITSPDVAGNVGWSTSLALDSDGYPVVSYYELLSRDLRILHCNDPNCEGDDESISSPDTTSNFSWWTSLVLDSGGNPMVTYNPGSGDLKLLHCDDPNCAGDEYENITSPDSSSPVGWSPSLAMDSRGNPVISYIDRGNNDLKLLHCNDPNCADGDETITSPDTFGDINWSTSLALDGSGNPVVSYNDYTNFDLKILHCNDPNCAGGDESITSPDTGGSVGWYTSLELDSSGNPVVSYFDRSNRDLKILHCNDPNCDDYDESVTSPDTVGDVGTYTSLALDSGGNPVVSYWDRANLDLKLLHCGNANCTTNSPPTVDAGGPYHGLQNNAIFLSGANASDADGDSLTFSWSVDSSDCAFSNATALNPSLTCSSAGNYIVTLSADDGQDSTSDSADVTVITPEQGIINLENDIHTLLADGVLRPGQANGLTRPLDNALRSLGRGNTADACNQIQDFIAEVMAKTPVPLDAATAAGLVENAEAIRTALGCS